MAINIKAIEILTFSGGWVDGGEASAPFVITGDGTTVGNPDPVINESFQITLDYGGGITQIVTATVQFIDLPDVFDYPILWSATIPALDQTLLTSGLGKTVSISEVPTSASYTNTPFVFDYIVCYVRGTHIATPAGERRVEELAAGELILTASGAARAIKWIGHRHIPMISHRRKERAGPVRIQKDAFAPGVPHCDLLVSPDHAILADGALICARQLINGSTIRRDLDLDSVDYFHVELVAHDILIAEGLEAESYLDTGNRGFFVNADAPLLLHPDLMDPEVQPTRRDASCRPFASDEASVLPVWRRLAERAALLGLPVPTPDLTDDPELTLVAKGRKIKPIQRDTHIHVFVLPIGTAAVKLASRSGLLTDSHPWLAEDARRLGVAVSRIVVRGNNAYHTIPLDSPSLVNGWWGVEREGIAMWRWTDGDAVVPLPEMRGPCILEVHLRGTATYVARSAGLARAA